MLGATLPAEHTGAAVEIMDAVPKRCQCIVNCGCTHLGHTLWLVLRRRLWICNGATSEALCEAVVRAAGGIPC